MFPGGDTLAERRQRRVALRVWAGRGDATGVFRRQTESLAEALPRVPFESLSVVAVANYALGSELAESDLDLQQATALAERARDLRAHDVAVRALPVVREVRDEGVFWRPRPAEVERLVAALDLGLWPPRTDGGVETATRPGGVIVALPAAMDVALAGRFMTGLRDAVAGSAGPSIEVTTLRYGPSALEASFTATVAAARPLAVVLVGAPERAGEEAEAETARAQTIDCAAVLRALYQPSVLVVPVVDSGVGEELRPPDELEETGLPLVVAAVPGDGSGDAASAASTTSSTPGPTESPSPASPPASPLPPPTSPEEPSTSPAIGSGAVLDSRPAWEQTGRLAAAAAVRACWPVVLAPSLPGTRRGVTFAERRTAGLTVVEAEGAAATRAWLAACGYVVEADGGEWAPEAGVVHVVHHPGLRRLAAAVAGDLGVATALIAEDEDAPAPLTVVP